jgi:cytochrome c biogenesis protein CcmG, thiol:disulfide interchange protein DsbE
LPSTPSSTDGDRGPSRRAIVALIAGSIVVPLALLGGILVTRRDNGSSDAVRVARHASADVKVGQALPDFTVPDVAGKPVRLSHFRGKPLVLTFFASWCNPCEKEMPLLERAHRDDPHGFGVLAVSYDDLARDSRAFVRRLGVTYAVGLDTDGQVRRAYGVTGIPQTFFVDANGVLRDRVYGITSKQALDEPLTALLRA